jgi:hypothetical protein
MPSSQPNDPLSSLLAQWRVQPRRNPAFRAEIWARIEAAPTSSSWAGFARAHRAMVVSAFVAALLVGGWTGREEAHQRREHDRTMLAANYVHALDARWMRQP